MKQTPGVFQIDNIIQTAKNNQTCIKWNNEIDVWIPARPYSLSSFKNRLRATWLVFTGRADALLWRGQ